MHNNGRDELLFLCVGGSDMHVGALQLQMLQRFASQTTIISNLRLQVAETKQLYTTAHKCTCQYFLILSVFRELLLHDIAGGNTVIKTVLSISTLYC